MKLYYVPRTRAVRCRWFLEELEVPYELVRLDPSRKENRQPEYLKIHPLGHVPALQDGELSMMESAAICLYLADKYPEKKLAPPPGSKERGEYYQWCFFAMTTLEPPLIALAESNRPTPEEKRSPGPAAEAGQRLKEVLTALEARWQGRSYAAGTHFTAADVVLGGTLAWASVMGHLEGFPALQAYVREMTSRPAFRRARTD